MKKAALPCLIQKHGKLLPICIIPYFIEKNKTFFKKCRLRLEFFVKLSLFTNEEEGKDAGAGMSTDDRTHVGNQLHLCVVVCLQNFSQLIYVFLTIAVRDVHDTICRIDSGFAQLFCEGGDRILSASYFGYVDEVSLVIHMKDGLDAQLIA